MLDATENYYDMDLVKLGLEGEQGITQQLFTKYGKSYESKKIIIREGDNSKDVYIIVAGRVVVCEKIKAGSYRVLASLGPGELFGEMALLEESSTRSATLIAASSVKVLQLTSDDFSLIFKTHTRWAFKLMSAFSQRIVNAFNQIETHYQENR